MTEMRMRREEMQKAKVKEKLGMEQAMAVYNEGAKRLNKMPYLRVDEFTAAISNRVLAGDMNATIEFGML